MSHSFKCELDNFVCRNLIPYLKSDYADSRYNFPNYWEKERHYRLIEKIKCGKVGFPPLTNHEICHEMFWNAFMGNTEMYIQMPDIRYDEPSNVQNNGETITLQCSLLTSQMIDYDIMMFEAMGDLNNAENRNAALEHYRPYFFDFVAELKLNKDIKDIKDKKCMTYNELQELQGKLAESEDNFSLKEYDGSPYLWLACKFTLDKSSDDIIDGYIVQSASRITKTNIGLKIIDGNKASVDKIKKLLDSYTLSNCVKTDADFIKSIAAVIGNNNLLSVDAYKIGNGNCVFAQGANGGMSFFMI